jgi:hypothetical protein
MYRACGIVKRIGSNATVEFMPAIIRFLGYNPLPPGTSRAERLISCRTAMGITQGESACRIGVDQGTLARWKRGEREPAGDFAVRAKRFLAGAESAGSALSTQRPYRLPKV